MHISFLRFAVLFVGVAVAVEVVVDAVRQAVVVGVGEGLSQIAVAVGVDLVAELHGPGVDVGVQVVAVLRAGDAVAVGVGVGAVGRPVPVQVGEPVHDAAVAVAVHVVAGLLRAWEARRVQVVAVRVAIGAVPVDVLVDAVGQGVAVQIVEPVGEVAVAVAVDLVAGLGGAREHEGVGVVAVRAGGVAVLVAVDLRLAVDCAAGEHQQDPECPPRHHPCAPPVHRVTLGRPAGGGQGIAEWTPWGPPSPWPVAFGARRAPRSAPAARGVRGEARAQERARGPQQPPRLPGREDRPRYVSTPSKNRRCSSQNRSNPASTAARASSRSPSGVMLKASRTPRIAHSKWSCSTPPPIPEWIPTQ